MRTLSGNAWPRGGSGGNGRAWIGIGHNLAEGDLWKLLGTGRSEKHLGELPDQGRGALVWRVTPSKPPKASGGLAVFVPRDFITAAFFAARF